MVKLVKICKYKHEAEKLAAEIGGIATHRKVRTGKYTFKIVHSVLK